MSQSVFSREAPRIRPRLLQLGVHALEGRGHLLVAGGQLDRHEGDEQDPDRAVELERRVGVGQKERDAEHDAGNGDRRGRQDPEILGTRQRAPRHEIGHDQRDGGDDRGRHQTEQERVAQCQLRGGKLEQDEVSSDAASACRS